MASEQVLCVQTKYLSSSNPSLPPLALQITQLVDSYMLWIGVAEGDPEQVEMAALRGSLCKDWACAMPATRLGMIAPATSLFRPSSTDIALSMAQRLAKRFEKQIFLSVDLPVTLGHGQQLVLEAEKGIVQTLKELEHA